MSNELNLKLSIKHYLKPLFLNTILLISLEDMKELGYIYFVVLGLGLLVSIIIFIRSKIKKVNLDTGEAQIDLRENKNKETKNTIRNAL